MTAPDHAAKRYAMRRLAVVGAGSLAGIALGLAAVYGISALLGNRGTDAGCGAAVETAERVAPLVRGEVAAMALASKPQRVPDLAFQDGTGAQRHLSDWSGRTVLLNLWATWCVPCRKEMPALDALQAELGSERFEVVALRRCA